MTYSDEITIIIPARKGSKGFPEKNTKTLNGSPLYMHTINQASRLGASTIFSTDIPEIQEKDLPSCCTLSRRPAKLASDDTPMEGVISYLIDTHSLINKTIILLQVTSPLRSDDDIKRALSLFNSGTHDLVMSVVEKDQKALKTGTLNGSTFRPLAEPSFCFKNRQSLPRVYSPNGAIYIFKADAFIRDNAFPTSNIGAIDMPPERSIDIDSEQDLTKAQKNLST